MRIIAVTFVALVSLVAFHNPTHAQVPPANDPKAERIALVREFLGEIEGLYDIQQTSNKETAEDPSATGKLMTGIRVGTRTLLAMNEDISRLKMMNVPPNAVKFRDLLIAMHQQRISLVAELTRGAKTVLAGPQPGVNYGALVARAPELTAEVEAVDKNLFTMSQAMFFMLVDDGRIGSDGKLHHLLITKKQRASILHEINTAFGANVDDKNATYIVSAAWVLKEGLTRPIYQAADEP